MSNVQSDPLLQVETTCGSLLYELQVLYEPSIQIINSLEFTLYDNSKFFPFPSPVPITFFEFFCKVVQLQIVILSFPGFLCYHQIIWDEVGESDTDRDKMLLELERECLEVYRRKVDQANRCRAQLRQAIADSEAELAAICSAMGERPVHIRQVSIT